MIEIEDVSFTYRTGEANVEQVLAAARSAGVTVRDLATEEPDLEDVFLAQYGGPGHEPAVSGIDDVR